MKIINKSNASIIVLIFLAIIALSCSVPAKEEQSEEHHEEAENEVELSEAQYKTAAIALGKIEKKQINGTIKVNGTLDVPPQQLVSVSVPLGGFLKNTELLQGSRVKKGQIIATMENIDYIQIQQDYIETKGQFEFAKADYERQLELAQENINAQKTLQQSKLEFSSAQARYNGLKEKLKVIGINLTRLETGHITSTVNIHAPISGYVTEVSVNVGKFVSPSDIMFEIVDTEHLHAELIIFEKDIPKIKIGQTVRFMLANESKERTAKVFLIGREISSDRTIRIHCHIDEEDTNLLPGMFLKGVVENNGEVVDAVPNQSVIDFQGKKYIFVLNNEEAGEEKERAHHFIMLEVQTGNSEFGFTEITWPEATEPDKLQVVTQGAYDLLSKLKNSKETGHAH